MGQISMSRRVLLAAPLGLAMTPAVFARQQTDLAPSVPSDEAPNLLDAWIDAYGRPTAAVTINGAGPYRFLVDTGATTTVVGARHAEAMGLEPLGLVRVNGTTGTAELPMASAALLSAGGVRRRNLRVALIDEVSFAQWDGILGADVFVGHKLTFDIARKVVRLERSGLEPLLSTRPKPNIRLRNGMLPELKGKVGGIPATFVVDTGADGSIINLALARTLNLRFPSMRRQPNVVVTGVTGSTLVGEAMALPRVDLPDISAADCVAVAADASIFRVWNLHDQPAMLVGIDLLSRLKSFTIDYRSRRFEATPMAQLMSGDPTSAG